MYINIYIILYYIIYYQISVKSKYFDIKLIINLIQNKVTN